MTLLRQQLDEEVAARKCPLGVSLCTQAKQSLVNSVDPRAVRVCMCVYGHGGGGEEIDVREVKRECDLLHASCMERSHRVNDTLGMTWY